MAKKQEPEKAPNHERWLLTYADMITLLLTLFVVLYALSMVDKNRMAQLAESLRQAFNVSPGGSANHLIQMNGQVIPMANMNIISEAEQPQGANDQEDKQRLAELEDALDQYVKNNNVVPDVDVEMEEKGLVIRLSEAMLFESAQAEVKSSAVPKIIDIGKMINKVPNYIRVEGHTDSIPIHNGQFRSNWQLSAERATHVTELLIRASKVAPQRLSAMGYGEYRPLAPNTTDIGRAKNRRVDIIIMKSMYNSAEEDR